MCRGGCGQDARGGRGRLYRHDAHAQRGGGSGGVGDERVQRGEHPVLPRLVLPPSRRGGRSAAGGRSATGPLWRRRRRDLGHDVHARRAEVERDARGRDLLRVRVEVGVEAGVGVRLRLRASEMRAAVTLSSVPSAAL